MQVIAVQRTRSTTFFSPLNPTSPWKFVRRRTCLSGEGITSKSAPNLCSTKWLDDAFHQITQCKIMYFFISLFHGKDAFWELLEKLSVLLLFSRAAFMQTCHAEYFYIQKIIQLFLLIHCMLISFTHEAATACVVVLPESQVSTLLL